MSDNREQLVIDIDKNSLLKQLKIDPEVMYDRVINPVLNAGEEALTYGEKVLQMIEAADILPNEEAFLIVAGIEHLFQMMNERDTEEDKDGV